MFFEEPWSNVKMMVINIKLLYFLILHYASNELQNVSLYKILHV